MKLRHVGITVTHLQESINFYRNNFGFSIIREMDESGDHIDRFSGLKGIDVRTVKMADGNGGLIELLYYRSHPKSKSHNLSTNITNIGCSHFALTVENLPDVCESLTKQGATLLCEPQMSPDGKVLLTFCKDPDGTLIELVEELDGV